MKIAKLFGKDGRELTKPVVFDGSISWQGNTGDASAFDSDGVKVVAEMKFARIKWVEVGGMRIEGAEPISLDGQKFIHQAWHIQF